MKHFIFTLAMVCYASVIAQTAPLTYTIKKGNQEILLSLPAGTIIYNNTAVTINGWPVNIIVVEKSIYDNDSLQNKNDFHLLDAIFNASISAASQNLLEKPIAIISPVKDGSVGIFWVENFKDQTLPSKISGCMMAGNYIVTISTERTLNKENLTGEAFKHTQFIREIFNDVVVMKAGQCIMPASMSITNKKPNHEKLIIFPDADLFDTYLRPKK